MATTNDPTPSAASTDHRGLRRMGLEECTAKLREATVGRVAFVSDGEIVILPVNPVVDGTTILFRTSWGAKYWAAELSSQAAFEIDGFDADSATGWSVLAQGTFAIVDDRAECERLDRMAPAAWLPPSDASFWVAIRPHDLSGREILPR
ncbi:pyridoxamine 5'-phosphate oxidase family protein [Cumulibacter manganitolerans]|uniref:pyridoxamine 5'-phosphate oxidase family protein n=1 Tax=Cumulibacter manganitolerans TaxID=1884992 RepID=UPI001295F6DB|nr:pyridoxamine 5'-phosphate oxidase family protein [Cumulibacter manganitolerans]